MGRTFYNWNSPLIIALFCLFMLLTPIWLYYQSRPGEKATLLGTPGTIREPWGSENAKMSEFSVSPPHNMEKL